MAEPTFAPAGSLDLHAFCAAWYSAWLTPSGRAKWPANDPGRCLAVEPADVGGDPVDDLGNLRNPPDGNESFTP